METLGYLLKVARGASRDNLQSVYWQNGFAYATDSYRAVRVPVAIGDAGSVDGRSILAIGPNADVRNMTLRDAIMAAVPSDDDAAIRATRRVFDDAAKAIGTTVVLPGAITTGWNAGRLERSARDIRDAIAQWSYWDGERRKPSGIVRLNYWRESFGIRLGLCVDDKARMPSFVGFGETRMTTTATVDRDGRTDDADVAALADAELASRDDADGAAAGTFNAEYVADAIATAGSGEIVFRFDLSPNAKPVLITVGAVAGTVETLIMPIRF